MEIAEIASGCLSEDYPFVIRDEDGQIKVNTGAYGEYIDIEDFTEINDDDREKLRDLLGNSYIDSISRNTVLKANSNSTDKHIRMHIKGELHGWINYYIYFVDPDDLSSFKNPMEGYDEGGFAQDLDYENNTVSWVSDHRYDLTSSEPHVAYRADLAETAEGIWICRCEMSIPLLYGFLYG